MNQDKILQDLLTVLLHGVGVFVGASSVWRAAGAEGPPLSGVGIWVLPSTGVAPGIAGNLCLQDVCRWASYFEGGSAVVWGVCIQTGLLFTCQPGGVIAALVA